MKRSGQGGTAHPGTHRRVRITGFAPALLALVLFAAAVPGALARDAAFLDPASSSASNDDAIKVEPKNDIDIGESTLNVARRNDIFFENQTGSPIKVEKVTVNGDGNVATEIVADDCTKQGAIQPNSRCSVGVSLTPSSPGPWTAEVMLTHDGAGRIARAKLSGKTAGVASTEKKDMGLALNSKESPPVNFGDVNIDDGGKVVRSALMVNDSTEPITLYSIDVIEASNGLQKLDQGCAVDMELKSGESCPVTLVWSPTDPGQISTDLIIRHSGRLGFAVIPIRGLAKGAPREKSSSSSESADASASSSSARHGIPLPPDASTLARAAGSAIPAVAASDLGPATLGKTPHHDAVPDVVLSLIGTVGNRAIILKPDGKTVVANAGEDFNVDEVQAKLVLVTAKSADVMIAGKKKTIYLGSSSDLIEKAQLSSKTKASSKEKDKDVDTSSSTSGSSTATSGTPAAAPPGVIGGPAGSGVPR